MSDLAIRVESLGKLYRIGSRQNGYKTIRETIVNFFSAPFRKGSPVSGHPSSVDSTVWALKDVSFDVRRGEVVGIIGRNGAGKSTLLKILSRITEPTAGWAEIHGRVGSLLEVGTGFHYELTGRENIHLSGAILGMSRSEIDRKFDEIVAFGEVEKFLDTPVKHYSSGMYMRLAFAVAAHLDTEVLLVDEVLAVGDAAFQKKCLGRMGDVAKEGRTVLFVSHNMAVVGSFCSRGILLKEGKIFSEGETAGVISKYLQSDLRDSEVTFRIAPDKPMQILSVRSLSTEGNLKNTFSAYEPMVIEIDYVVRSAQVGSTVACIIGSPVYGHLLSTGDWDLQPQWLQQRPPGRYRARIQIPSPLFNSGTYSIAVGMGIPPHIMYDRKDCLRIEVQDDSGKIFDVGSGKRYGALLMGIPWDIQKQEMEEY